MRLGFEELDSWWGSSFSILVRVVECSDGRIPRRVKSASAHVFVARQQPT